MEKSIKASQEPKLSLSFFKAKNRKKENFLNTMPFDAHYLTILTAAMTTANGSNLRNESNICFKMKI